MEPSQLRNLAKSIYNGEVKDFEANADTIIYEIIKTFCPDAFSDNSGYIAFIEKIEPTLQKCHDPIKEVLLEIGDIARLIDLDLKNKNVDAEKLIRKQLSIYEEAATSSRALSIFRGTSGNYYDPNSVLQTVSTTSEVSVDALGISEDIPESIYLSSKYFLRQKNRGVGVSDSDAIDIMNLSAKWRFLLDSFYGLKLGFFYCSYNEKGLCLKIRDEKLAKIMKSGRVRAIGEQN